MTMEAKMSHDTLSASWRSRRASGVSPKAQEQGAFIPKGRRKC